MGWARRLRIRRPQPGNALLAAARHAGLQPESLGGRGTLDRIFEDRGNQMLMQAALWDLSRSGPKSFTLHDWFTAAPEERAWKSA